MKISPQTQQELEGLHEQFSRLEASTRSLEVAPVGALVVIRADGIKHSKHFLKDSLEQPDYHLALHEAIGRTHQIWRSWAPKPFRPYLLGALRLSDEVSFIVNRGENYYKRKLLKITTTLASTLSGAMSLTYAGADQFQGELDRAPIMAFDGRALVLDDVNELGLYIRCRRLLFSRNAMARVLRLESGLTEGDLYDGGERKLASDIYRLSLAIDERGLWEQYERAAGGSALYIARASGELEGVTLASDPEDDGAVHRALAKLEV